MSEVPLGCNSLPLQSHGLAWRAVMVYMDGKEYQGMEVDIVKDGAGVGEV